MTGAFAPEEGPMEFPVLVEVALGEIRHRRGAPPETTTTEVHRKVYYTYGETEEEALKNALKLAAADYPIQRRTHKKALAFKARSLWT